jgi:four helix bundle protein
MAIQNFKDLEAWKEARILVKDVYVTFSQSRDFGFRDQIQRAAISIMSNIAEGFDRGSNKELIQFLIIARGSVSEVKSLSYAALDIEYIDANRFNSIMDRCGKLANLINGFIRNLRNSERKC